MTIDYIETSGDVKMTVKASNKELKSVSEVINVIYTLCNLFERK